MRTASRPQRGRRTTRRRTALAALLVALAPLGVPPRTAVAAAPTPEAGFGRFATAWSTRATDSIVGCMEPKGKVVLSLFAYPLSGKTRVMGPEQAKEALKIYFRRLTTISLKDVTPKKSPHNVRLYEYAYRAHRENARTTHLQVKLKQDDRRRWVLASVTESVRPQPR